MSELEELHDALNEISDLVNTAIVTDKMSADEVHTYYQERLQRIYDQKHKAMVALMRYEDRQKIPIPEPPR